MTASLDTQTTNGTTLRVWLGVLAIGTYLTADHVAEPYMWTGKFHDGMALLFRPTDMNIVELRDLDQAYSGTGWRVHHNANTLEAEIAGPKLRNAAVAWADQYVQLQDQIAWASKARSDWALLNERLNAEAVNRGWCSDYDRCVEDWNGEFQVLELQPREREYEVEATVTATWTVRYTVTERDDDAARNRFDNEVGNNGFETFLDTCGECVTSPDDWSYEVDSVDLA